VPKIIISSLKNQAAFDRANKIGKRQNSRFFLMISHMHESDKSANTVHLGLKISKKMGKAVVRNKIRRRLKSLMRAATKALPENIWASRVFVIIPRKGLDLVKYSELEEEFIKYAGRY
jgi:ribonuclease P protein component